MSKMNPELFSLWGTIRIARRLVDSWSDFAERPALCRLMRERLAEDVADINAMLGQPFVTKAAQSAARQVLTDARIILTLQEVPS